MLKKFLAACLISSSANATTFSTDSSDLWYNPNESGWGVSVIQQGYTLFATMFVYSSTGAPAWYVSSEANALDFQPTNALMFSGPLLQTTGPWFGTNFNSAPFTFREVGHITFSFTGVSEGTVSYTIDGVSVSKSITRQNWRTNDLSGSYIGATVGSYSSCPSGNGPSEEPGVFSVSHPYPGATVSIAANYSSGHSCTYSGAYQQSGRMGTINGTVSCSNGAQGAFLAVEVEANISGMTGRVFAQLGGICSWSGRFGGIRR